MQWEKCLQLLEVWSLEHIVHSTPFCVYRNSHHVSLVKSDTIQSTQSTTIIAIVCFSLDSLVLQEHWVHTWLCALPPVHLKVLSLSRPCKISKPPPLTCSEGCEDLPWRWVTKGRPALSTRSRSWPLIFLITVGHEASAFNDAWAKTRI